MTFKGKNLQCLEESIKSDVDRNNLKIAISFLNGSKGFKKTEGTHTVNCITQKNTLRIFHATQFILFSIVLGTVSFAKLIKMYRPAQTEVECQRKHY